jgi:hypothetical protein
VKNCEENLKKKEKHAKATLNISNNNPGIVTAEKNKQKRNSFLPKILGLGA